jgi:hypothetical protein
MSEWIDLSVYAAMTAMYWFVCARWAPAWALQMVADRNEDWLTGNRERIASLLRGRWLVGSSWFMWSCYGWGAISLTVLLAIQVRAWPQLLSASTVGSPHWEVLKDAHSALLIVGLLSYFGVVIVSTRRVHKDVPLAERRRASLIRRSVNDFVPRWLSNATYVLIAVHLAAWLIVGALGLYSLPDFWVRFLGPVVFTGINLAIAHGSVDRRLSDSLGFHDRRLGVRFAFGSLIYSQFMFLLKLYGEIVGPSFEVDRTMHLALVLMIVLAMLGLALFWGGGGRGVKPALYDPA